jgi:hypothetical protein
VVLASALDTSTASFSRSGAAHAIQAARLHLVNAVHAVAAVFLALPLLPQMFWPAAPAAAAVL